ncbi:MAG TPA: YitT family protein [Clostridia bacterium]|nr:YitT family protein [Clostridia bacterium]
MTRKNHVLREIRRYVFLLLGSVLAATGLEIFLIPNKLIDGGVVGISLIVGYLTQIPFSIFVVLFNLPFLFIGYKQIGKTFVFSSLFSIVSLSLWTTLLHPVPGLTDDVLLASVFGGIILGIGVGLIIRYGGSLDGTEMVSIIINRKTAFSVGELVMFFNIFILGSSGLIFGWDKAMYSLIAYFIAFKVIDVTIEGLDEAKAAIIISDRHEDIAEAIMARLGRGVTYLEGKGAFSNDHKTVLYSVVTRLEIAKLKSIIHDKDENAFVTINDVSDVMGGKHRKRSIH